MPSQAESEKLILEDFIFPTHLPFFIKAAEEVKCDILVRKTGRRAIRWIGEPGFTGKLANMKAKTADVDYDAREVAGLVCSPEERPQVFSPDRLEKAWKEWRKSEHLITVPNSNRGFDDTQVPVGCPTPYILQNNPDSFFYGAVAFVDSGILRPHYVHGDYDLYDIVPNLSTPPTNAPKVRENYLVQTVKHPSMSPEQIANARVKNLESPWSFKVANIINVAIAMAGGDMLSALMINHGEQTLLGEEGRTDEPVLAVLSRPENGVRTRILMDWPEHVEFYRSRVM